jgi:glycosyltransferase involved in cell wall biosynthesis
MIRILHVISGLGMGGAERNLVQIAATLRARDMAQHVVCAAPRGIWADELEARGIPVTILGIRSTADVPRALFRLWRLVDQLRPRVLQGWMYHGNLLAAFVHRVAGRRETRLFWNLRASNMNEGGYCRILRWSARLSAWPDVVLANSKTGLDFHIAQGFRPRMVEVIPNGIDTDKFRPSPGLRSQVRAELGIPDHPLVALHVARVDAMKDHATFLAGMAEHPRLYGLLVGAGTEKLSVPNNVRALGLRRDVDRLYASADIVVSTSAFGEGFSNVLAEGMSAGLVPIATDVGDAQSIVGETGYLIPPRNSDALAKVIGIEAKCEPNERRSRGIVARARIVENFALTRATDRYHDLYLGGQPTLPHYG